MVRAAPGHRRVGYGDLGRRGSARAVGLRRLARRRRHPAVAPFVAEELGAAMGVSTQSAMSLMADALDLRHRFPLLWAKVEAREVAPYKTRRVAADTRSLPFEAARWVDEQLAARVDGFGIPTIERLVALAAARFAPEEQAEKEQPPSRSGTSPSPTRAPVSSPAPPGSRPPATPQDLTAFYAARLRRGQAARPARGHRRLRDPQGQGPRHHRRPAGQPSTSPTRHRTAVR